MKNNIITYFSCFALALIFAVAPAFGQTYEEKRQELLQKQTNTRAEINVLDARIKTYEQRIDQTQNQETQFFQQYQEVNRLISLQDDKLGNLENEQSQIQEEIALTEGEIELREKELKQLIDNYKEILLYTYKNGRTTNLELLVTSKSINQMLIRSYYLQKLEEQKEKQARQIKIRQGELEEVKGDLEQSHLKNELVLEEIRDEKVKLGDQQTVQLRNIERIKVDRTNLLEKLRQDRNQLEDLTSNFNNLIAEEERIRQRENERLAALANARNINNAARRAEEIAKYSTPTTSNFVTDETLASFEQTFSVLKGKLPWPVNSTTVSQKFGITRNPIYGTNTEHPGISIVADPGSEVRAVSDGQVFAILPSSGFGDVVYVKHGTYYTAYGNLSQINISNGAVVQAGTVLGLSGTNTSFLGEVLFFMVRKNRTDLNPEEWLQAK